MRLAFVSALPFFGLATQAQQYAFTQFTPREGLAQSQVRCMAQDAHGYLWFGTLGGASRFDGHGFTNYALQEGLPDAQVNAMITTRSGVFWLAAGSSLTWFDGQRMRPVAMPTLTGDARVLAFALKADDDLLIATDGAGVFMKKDQVIAPLEGFPNDTVTSVRALLSLPDGSVLIGARNGLFRWKNGSCVPVALGGAQESVSTIVAGRDGVIWVGTFGDGVFRIDADGVVSNFDEERGLLQNNVRTLLVDERGRAWIGSKLGVNVWDGDRMRSFTVHQGLPNDNVYCLFQDNERGIWLGTDGAGVMRYTGDRFVTWTVTDGLCSDLVMTMVNDARGDLWLGTYGNGVCRFDAMATLTTVDGLPNNTVWCGVADTDSSLWFGTSDGLCHVVRGHVIALDSARRLDGQRVLALHLDVNRRMWCGTREGLVIIAKDGQIDRVSEVAGIALRSVRAIVEADGAFWLASDDGLVRMRGGAAKRWTTQQGLCDNTISCIFSDTRHRLWIGTSNGLSCFDGDRFTTVRLGQDFGSNYIDFLIGGTDGSVWAGTNNGVFHFQPDSLLGDPSSAEHFTSSDGLRGLECNLNSAFIDKNGRVFFGTNAGVVMHDPARDPKDLLGAPPTALIIGLRSFLQATDWKGQCDSLSTSTGLPAGLRLVYKRNHITFDYTTIALGAGDRVRFQYRLLGSDPDWLPATDARSASYSNLSQGEYVFEVRASSRAGNWGPANSFTFSIAPPFWLRWWFFAICATAIGLSLYAVMRFRSTRRARTEKTRQLMLRSRMLQLEQQALNANMNRHFIFNALNSIQYYINKQERAVANRYLTSFAKLIRKNLDASQTDTTSLAEEIERLELYLTLEHMRFKDKFRYQLHIDPAVDLNTIDIPAMMLQPYVENSIWHGILPMEHQGSVDISIANIEEGRVRITIADDGIGIENSRASKNGDASDHISRGIEISKGRADVLRRLNLTDIRITGPEQTTDGAGQPSGTLVTIELPSKNNVGTGEPHLRTEEHRITFERS